MGKRVSFCVDEHYFETYSKEVRILQNFNLYSIIFEIVGL